MATNQESLQASIRTRSGNTQNLTFNGDWHALFTAEGVAAGTFNGRLLTWLNTEMSSSYTRLQEAQNAYAAVKGVTRWSDLTSVAA